MPSREQHAAFKEWLTNEYPKATDHFQLLGVHKQSTKDQIDGARSVLARILHPDRWATDSRRQPLAAAAMAEVNMAHTVLTSKDRRLRYLAELATGRSRCPTCQGEGVIKERKGFKSATLLRCKVCGGSGLLLHKERK